MHPVIKRSTDERLAPVINSRQMHLPTILCLLGHLKRFLRSSGDSFAVLLRMYTVGLVVSFVGLFISTAPAIAVTAGVSSAISPSITAGGSIFLFILRASVVSKVKFVSFSDVLREEVGNGLSGLLQNLGESWAQTLVPFVVERNGFANVTDATSTSDAVDILVDSTVIVGRHVEVDDKLDSIEVDTTST